MVTATVVATNGSLCEVSIPAKTTDVLEWLRKKYKQPGIQFQGKIQDPLKEERWLCVFAKVSAEEDDANQHMLPSPLDEESYSGAIIILATMSDSDEYGKSVTSYVSLSVEDYETLYHEWSFNVSDDEEEALDEEEEEVDDIIEEPDEAPRVSAPVVAKTTKTKNVFVTSPIRDKVTTNLAECTSQEVAEELENYMLHNIVNYCKSNGIDVDWANKIFWNTYRSKAISLYENLRTDGRVENTENWAQKLLTGEVEAKAFVEMPAEELCPSRWKAALDKMVDTEFLLYSMHVNAAIYLYCSRC
jgi:hypothetical protein